MVCCGCFICSQQTIYRCAKVNPRSGPVPQQLEQLYALCLSDIDSRVKKMQLAASSGDNATYRSEAHAIKGSCGMVGAMELQSLATSMEKNGLTGNNVVSFKEFLVAAQRLRRMLIAREISNNQGSAGEDAR